jgi:hypothetical protein
MKSQHIIIGLIIILVVLFLVQQKEHASSTPANTPNLSNEAIQNISKVYADTSNTATFNNLTATGIIRGNVTGNITGNVTGNITGNVTGDLTSNNININNKFLITQQSVINTDKGGAVNGSKLNIGTSSNPSLTVYDNGNSRVKDTLIVKKLCFEDGTCIKPTDGLIGIQSYRLDNSGRTRGVQIAADGNGNDASINALGASVHWLNVGNPYTGNNFTASSTPYI